jgi:hypothetical protein
MPRATFANPPFHENRPGLVAPVSVDPSGKQGPTPKQARGPLFRRSSRGLYVPISGEQPVEQRIVEASGSLVLDGWVTGWASLRWHGGTWFDGLARDGRTPLPVPLATSIDQPEQPGTAVFREVLWESDVEVVDSLPVTTAVRSLFHVVRRAPSVRAAVRAIDLAAYSDLVSIKEFRAYLASHAGWRGVVQGRAACDLADENVLSPRETSPRLVWLLDGGWPAPLVNRPVFNKAGKHLGTPDLFDPEAGLVIEYDGQVHLDAARRKRDRDREEAFRTVDLEYVTILGQDTEAAILRRLGGARSRARFVPPGQRRWTLEQPHWWVSTETVAQRRNLTAAERATWLNLRLRT